MDKEEEINQLVGASKSTGTNCDENNSLNQGKTGRTEKLVEELDGTINKLQTNLIEERARHVDELRQLREPFRLV